MKFLILILLFPLLTFSTPLFCTLKNGGLPLRTAVVDSELQVKIPLMQDLDIRSFVTQKSAGFFSLEVYLINQEARFYGEGFLKTSADTLTASFWNRDLMIDVICRTH